MVYHYIRFIASITQVFVARLASAKQYTMSRILTSLLFVGVIALDIHQSYVTGGRDIVLDWTIEGVSEYTARYAYSNATLK